MLSRTNCRRIQDSAPGFSAEKRHLSPIWGMPEKTCRIYINQVAVTTSVNATGQKSRRGQQVGQQTTALSKMGQNLFLQVTAR
jgi:hypothetical protein